MNLPIFRYSGLGVLRVDGLAQLQSGGSSRDIGEMKKHNLQKSIFMYSRKTSSDLI